VLVQRWDQGVHGSHTLRAEVGRDADLLTVLAAQGGGVVKADLGATLTGHGAHSELVGVLLADGDQHLDHHTLHDHRAPHTWSNINLKVALSGHARSAYTGLIRIDPAAPGSEAYQENRNLLLSDHCRADTIPELEILTDDVVCTHGATVAPIDREQVFYLESRGLPTVGAQRLIVRGFVQGALERVPEGLRAGVEEQVERRLAALGAAQRRPA
jgi:Fe-S cluster assembly protein SufD